MQFCIKNKNLYSRIKELNLTFNNFKHLFSLFALFIYPENHQNIYYEIFQSTENNIEEYLREYQEKELSNNTLNNLYSYLFSYDKTYIEHLNKIEYDKELHLFCFKNIYIQNQLKTDIISKCFKLKLDTPKIITYNGTISSLLKLLVKSNYSYLNFIPKN